MGKLVKLSESPDQKIGASLQTVATGKRGRLVKVEADEPVKPSFQTAPRPTQTIPVEGTTSNVEPSVGNSSAGSQTARSSLPAERGSKHKSGKEISQSIVRNEDAAKRLGAAVSGTARNLGANTSGFLAALVAAAEEMDKEYRDAKEKAGITTHADEMNPYPKTNEEITRGNRAGIGLLEGIADTQRAKAKEDLDAAKEGLGTAGKVGIDAFQIGMNLAGIVGANAILPGLGTAALAVSSGGSLANQYREGHYVRSDEDAVAYLNGQEEIRKVLSGDSYKPRTEPWTKEEIDAVKKKYAYNPLAAAGLAIGGAASVGVGSAAAKGAIRYGGALLNKIGLGNSAIAQNVLGALSDIAFAGGMSGTNELAKKAAWGDRYDDPQEGVAITGTELAKDMLFQAAVGFFCRTLASSLGGKAEGTVAQKVQREYFKDIDNLDDLTKAFRQYGKQYHPDRFATADAATRQEMNDLFAKISAEYNAVKAELAVETAGRAAKAYSEQRNAKTPEAAQKAQATVKDEIAAMRSLVENGSIQAREAVEAVQILDAVAGEQSVGKSENIATTDATAQAGTPEQAVGTLENASTGTGNQQTVQNSSPAQSVRPQAEATEGTIQGATPTAKTQEQMPAALERTEPNGNLIAEGEMNNGKELKPTEPAEAGQNNISGRSGEWDAMPRAGGQAGVLGEGRSQRTAEQGRTAVSRQTAARDLQLQKISSQELGLENGTEAKSLYILPESAWDDTLTATAARVYEQTGKSVTMVLGAIPVQASDGTIRRVRGVWNENGIILQADHTRVSADQIADHEIFHDFADASPGLISDIERRICEQYGEEELWQVLAEYAQGLRGVVDLPENASEDEIDRALAEIKNEVFADAYAGINAFGAHAEKFHGAAKETLVDRGIIRRKETSAASDRKTGPPARFSYAGKNANGANLESLREAQEMLSAGADMESIRRATGWHEGMDGKWRWEIDDSKMEYRRAGDALFGRNHPEYAEQQRLEQKMLYGELMGTEEARLRALTETWGRERNRLSERVERGNARLEDILDHEELFRAYPQLRHVRVVFDETPKGVLGSFSAEGNQITISEELRDAPQDVLIHEIQHAIQNAEGFAKGSNRQYWEEKLTNGDEIQSKGFQEAREKLVQFQLDEANEEVLALRDQLEKAGELDDGFREYDRIWEEAERRGLDKKINEYYDLRENYYDQLHKPQRSVPSELYYNTAGEIEARDAANRRPMSGETRKRIKPDYGNGDTVFADGGDSYSVGETDDGRAVAVVDNDILSHIDTSTWDSTKKAQAKAAAKTALLAFEDGIQVNGITYKVNKTSRDEYTRSNQTERLSKKRPDTFADKMRAADIADDIITATTSWAKDGGLKHPRRDSFVDFAHGDVLIQAGANQYDAETVVGITADGEYVFYDVVDMTPTSFTTKKEPSPAAAGNSASSAIQESSSEHSISRSAEKSNREISGVQPLSLPTLRDAENGDGATPERVQPLSLPTLEPTAKVKFSLDEPVEETDKLLALHNLTEENLRGDLELGGLPMPSIAVVKAKSGHTDYGDISLVFSKDTIDPQLFRSNKVYGADAWTPTFPSVEYEADSKAEAKFHEMFYDLERRRGRDFAQPLYGLGNYLEDELNRKGGAAKIKDSLRDSTAMMNIYLDETGGEPVTEKVKTKKASRLDEETVARYDFLADRLGADVLRDLRDKDGKGPMAARKAWFAEHGDALKEAERDWLRQYGFTEEEVSNAMEHESMMSLTRDAVGARNYLANGAETVTEEVDTAATDKAIREKVDKAAYEKWLDELFAGAEKKKGIRNSKDMYTAQGNRRSFDALHYEITLENVVRAMREGEQKGGGTIFGGQSIWGVATKDYGSISDIKSDSKRLAKLSEEEFSEIRAEFSGRLADIANEIRDRSERNDFIAADNAAEIIADTLRKKKTVAAIDKELRSYRQLNIKDDTAQKVFDLFNDIANMPIGYFEAKPQWAVGFDEVLAAVMPDNSDAALRKSLQDRGVEVLTYKAGDEADRLEKVNSIEKARFSVDEDGTNLPDGWNERLDEELADREDREERERQKMRDRLNAQERAYAKVERAAKREEARKEKAAAKVAESRPTIAKRDLQQNLLNLFSIPSGQRAELGEMIEQYADRLLQNGELTQQDRDAFFDRMYESGVMTVPADEYYAEGRRAVVGGRIYVNDTIRGDLGDNWNDIRKRAFSAGVYLTNNPNDPGVDVWNAELADSMPGFFDEESVDGAAMLEQIIHVAEEGKDEKMSLAEYAAMLSKQDYISENEILDNLERQMDWALRTFAEKAQLEIHLRNRIGTKIAEEREKASDAMERQKERSEARSTEEKWRHQKAMERQKEREIAQRAKERDERRELSQRQRERKELQELQQKTLKQLQWLSKNRNRAAREVQEAWDEVLGDIDIYAVGAADEMRWSKKHNATWRDLADIYKDAKENDPNFLPSKELERIVARLDGEKIADMDVSALQDLYKAAVGLRTEFYNRNRVIGDDMKRMMADVYTDSKFEILNAPDGADISFHDGGGYDVKKPYKATVKEKVLNLEQLSPMNLIERMGGWNPNGTFYSFGKQLEEGERGIQDYTVKANRMLEEYLNEHQEWVKKADGQGKDAIWYEIEVPQLLELGMGDKPIFGPTVKVYMTPTQKVQMYLESKSYDNLRHMAGGRTFANKDLYSDGKRAEALAQGTTIKLAPETVKGLVKDLTPEEMELARVLDNYYNTFASKEINRVSNILYGYDKAMGKNYAPIYTNKNYTNSEIGVYDATAEGVGNLKARQYSANPSYNISALDAFEKHVEQTARFVGMAIPARNWQTLLNWQDKTNSMGDVITHKWGAEAKNYITDLLTALQSGRSSESNFASATVEKAFSNYISAVFGFNPSIVFKQLGSIPLGSAYLGFENFPSIAQIQSIDTGLIAKYTQDLAWRTLGYSMPETKQLKENPNWTQTNKPVNFLFGGGAITAMDGWAASVLWPQAENKVRRERPELEVGTQEQIDSGASPFYQAVAKEFNDAVARSQSTSDEVHQGSLRKSKNPITRAFTMFKSDSSQTYNAIRQKIGEAQYYQRIGADAETIRKAKRAVGAAVIAAIINAMWSNTVTFLAVLVKHKGKSYRNDDGELTAGSIAKEMAFGVAGDLAGIVTYGEELADIIGNVVTGDKWYGIDVPGMEQMVDAIESSIEALNAGTGRVKDLADIIKNGGSAAEYFRSEGNSILGEVKNLAKSVATYIPGVPVNNIEAYLLGLVRWISPEAAAAYDDAFERSRKSLLSGLSGGELAVKIRDLLEDRTGSRNKGTAEAIAELYEAGYKKAVPSATPSSISVNGEDVKLGAFQKQTFEVVWRGTVADGVDTLTSSGAFAEADQETREKMLDKLYKYAAEKAKEELFDGYELDSFAQVADAAIKAGGSAADWAAWYGAVSDKKDTEKYEALLDADMTSAVKKAIVGELLGTDMETESGKPTQYAKMLTILSAGLDMDDYLELKLTDAVDRCVKGIENGIAAKDAKKAAMTAQKVKDAAGDDAENVELYRAAVDAVKNQDQQMEALSMLMPKSEYAKLQKGVSLGITPESYVATRERIAQIDDNGSVNQEEATRAIRGIPGLTNEQKAILWQMQNKSWKSKSNPFSTSAGQRAYETLNREETGVQPLSLPSLGTPKETKPVQPLSLPKLGG